MIRAGSAHRANGGYLVIPVEDLLKSPGAYESLKRTIVNQKLEIEELAGVQWIPGAGSPPATQWPEVFRKIHAAGKRIQVFGPLEDLDIIADQIGDASSIIMIGAGGGPEDEDRIRAGLAKYGAI